MPALKRSSSSATTANSIATPSPDSDDFHSSPVRCSERVKVEWYSVLGVIKVTQTVCQTRHPPVRVPSPEKPEAIKQALKNTQPAPARGRENYDAVKRCAGSSPVPVDTMGCDAANWNEMDPQVRHAYHGISSNHSLFNQPTITSQYPMSYTAVSLTFFASDKSRISDL